ncbi:hypothetical protein A3H85_00360 [Candidatus Daviesbacteria bacterium RIFCSPLOWO2_02_FULL_40_8]|nr:MAG: hypothetical protein A2780_02025 [Candidatus Daviesbacteria bacterium RIFCSPHIGHO2_01_FULL_41_45]OGE66063.1 MAG: hypothetical protein A3H85_00360 [Candidatus Daviesbacteria bacterium RIFCSPLOWO2_02_FULL_40_8]
MSEDNDGSEKPGDQHRLYDQIAAEKRAAISSATPRPARRRLSDWVHDFVTAEKAAGRWRNPDKKKGM